MRPSYLLTCLSGFAVFSAAWSGSDLQDARAGPLRRQADSSTTDAPSTTASATPSGSATTAGATTVASTNSHNTTTHATTTTSIPQNLPPGQITLISPSTTAGSTSYYSVGADLTFVWNYTSLVATPTALDILVTANAAGLAVPTPFTLALNTSFSSPQTFTWDTGAYASQTPLPVGIYTLIVYDADAENGRWTIAEAGKLQSWAALSFGLYTTQAYTPLANSYVCATCNSAGSLRIGKETWGMLVGTVGTMMVGFVWFAGIAGMI